MLEKGQPGDRSVVIAYDEPDTHLDYGHQRDLVDLLRKQAEMEHVAVIVATHSMNLIDKVQIDDVFMSILSTTARQSNRYSAGIPRKKPSSWSTSPHRWAFATACCFTNGVSSAWRGLPRNTPFPRYSELQQAYHWQPLRRARASWRQHWSPNTLRIHVKAQSLGALHR